MQTLVKEIEGGVSVEDTNLNLSGENRSVTIVFTNIGELRSPVECSGCFAEWLTTLVAAQGQFPGLESNVMNLFFHSEADAQNAFRYFECHKRLGR